MYEKTDLAISKSDKPDKKLGAAIDGHKTVHFGPKGASGDRLHKDDRRENRDIDRQKKRKEWTKSGVETSGFEGTHFCWKNILSKIVDDITKSFRNLNVAVKRICFLQGLALYMGSVSGVFRGLFWVYFWSHLKKS